MWTQTQHDNVNLSAGCSVNLLSTLLGDDKSCLLFIVLPPGGQTCNCSKIQLKNKQRKFTQGPLTSFQWSFDLSWRVFAFLSFLFCFSICSHCITSVKIRQT